MKWWCINHQPSPWTHSPQKRQLLMTHHQHTMILETGWGVRSEESLNTHPSADRTAPDRRNPWLRCNQDIDYSNTVSNSNTSVCNVLEDYLDYLQLQSPQQSLSCSHQCRGPAISCSVVCRWITLYDRGRSQCDLLIHSRLQVPNSYPWCRIQVRPPCY